MNYERDLLVSCAVSSSHMRPNSVIDVFVAFKTLLNVYIAGQCGLPDGSKRLLMLNVVASRPLKRANPDRDILLFLATMSIAPHIAE